VAAKPKMLETQRTHTEDAKPNPISTFCGHRFGAQQASDKLKQVCRRGESNPYVLSDRRV
jgi:hypothetical protein